MKRKPATVRSRIMLIILAVLLPLLVLLNGYALYMRSMALQRLQEQGEYELLQHAQQMDEALRNARAYLNVRTDVAAELAVEPGNFSLQYQALQQLRQGMLFLSDVDMLFFYLPGEDSFLCRRSGNISYAQLMALNAYVRGQYGALSAGSWQLVEVAGTAYLYYHFNAYGVEMGGFVKAQTILSGIQDGERGFQYFLSDTLGSVYSAPQRLAQAGVALDPARATSAARIVRNLHTVHRRVTRKHTLAVRRGFVQQPQLAQRNQFRISAAVFPHYNTIRFHAQA